MKLLYHIYIYMFLVCERVFFGVDWVGRDIP